MEEEEEGFFLFFVFLRTNRPLLCSPQTTFLWGSQMSGELQEEEAVNLANSFFFWSPWLAYTHPERTCIYSHTETITLTTLFDIAVLPWSVRISGEAPGSLASIWVPAVVILKSFIWVPNRESRVIKTVQPDLQQEIPTITCRHCCINRFVLRIWSASVESLWIAWAVNLKASKA